MAVRGGARRAGAAGIVVLLGLVGAPAVGAQEPPAPVDPVTAPATVPVRDALLGRSAAVTGTAEGGFDGGDTLDITLTLQNTTAAPIAVAIPRGALFETEDETEQVGVVARPADEIASTVKAGVDPVVTIEPGETTVELVGFCAQRLDAGPNEVVPMTWAGVAEAPLTTVMTNIAAQRPSELDAQHAVWWVTDVPVVPVPPELDPLLEGVDTAGFAASPKRVVMDERYTPQWKSDQAIDPQDPFGDTPYPFTDPEGGAGPFAADDSSSGGGGGLGTGLGLLLMIGLIACTAIAIGLGRSSRPAPAAVHTYAGPTPPGWHPDPQRPDLLRYWNGSEWTQETRPS